jgi:lipid II:glycine glycyltransferase (peptidoglycan interpeptide bridge formation enzyme)
MGATMQEAVSVAQPARDTDRWKPWDDFIAREASSGFRQSSWYADFRAAHSGWGHFAAVLRDGKAIVGGGLVLKRSFARDKSYYYMPDGPALLRSDSNVEQEQTFRAIMRFVDSKRQQEPSAVSHLCIIPRWQDIPDFVQGFRASSHFYGVPRDTQCIDLTPSESAILAQMKEKGRYNIRLAKRHGVVVVEDPSQQGIEDFLDIYQETFTRKGLKAHDADYFRSLIAMLSAARRGSVFFAEYKGMRLATAIVVYSGPLATYYFGGSRAIHRNVMPAYVLHFEIMLRAKALGCETYDFMGVTPEADARNAWTDISGFKRKFGGQELHLVPALDYVYDPMAYQEWLDIQQSRRRDRHDRPGVMPAS